jgi:hypothetical protein
MIIEPTLALLEYDVLVWLDHQELVTVLAVIGDGEIFLYL